MKKRNILLLMLMVTIILLFAGSQQVVAQEKQHHKGIKQEHPQGEWKKEAMKRITCLIGENSLKKVWLGQELWLFRGA